MTQPPDLLGAPTAAVPPRRAWLAAVLVVVVAATGGLSSPDPTYEDDQPITAVVTLDLLKA